MRERIYERERNEIQRITCGRNTEMEGGTVVKRYMEGGTEAEGRSYKEGNIEVKDTKVKR